MSAETVFICYRRDDSGETAGRMFDRLSRDLPAGAVFRDLDSIPLGVDFREHVRQKLECARVVLVLIGRDWLTIRDTRERRRLDDAADHVRVEVELALRTPSVRVIPILCRQALMPAADDLPESMRDLAFKNGQPVRPDPDFHSDVDHLVKHIRRFLDDSPQKSVTPPQTAEEKPRVVRKKRNPPAAIATPAGSDISGADAKPPGTKPDDVKIGNAVQGPAISAPVKITPAPSPTPKPSEGRAKQVLTVLFVLVFYGLLLWGGFHLVRYAFVKLGEGIAWVKTRFATPTPAPGFDPNRILSEFPKQPTHPLTLSEKATNEILKSTWKPTPAPPLSLSDEIKLLTQPKQTPTAGTRLNDPQKLPILPTPPPSPPLFPKITPSPN